MRYMRWSYHQLMSTPMAYYEGAIVLMKEDAERAERERLKNSRKR